MWVERAFMALNVNCVMWKSASSNGWEYFIVWEDFGLSPMYAICVLFELFLFYFG